MSSYAKGRRLEYKVRDLFRSKGYVVIRAAQSKPIDLICLRGGRILLVECKSEKSTLSKSRKSQLLKLAEASGASLVLASTKKRRVLLVEVKTGSPLIF